MCKLYVWFVLLGLLYGCDSNDSRLVVSKLQEDSTLFIMNNSFYAYVKYVSLDVNEDTLKINMEKSYFYIKMKGNMQYVSSWIIKYPQKMKYVKLNDYLYALDTMPLIDVKYPAIMINPKEYPASY